MKYVGFSSLSVPIVESNCKLKVVPEKIQAVWHQIALSEGTTTNEKEEMAKPMARVGGSVHHCPSCSMGHSEPSPPKLSSVCPEALLGRHRAGSSERGLLEQIVSPHVSNFTQSVGLRSVGFHHSLCCIYKLIMGNASRRYIVPVRRPEPRCPSLVWAAKVSDKLLCFSAPPPVLLSWDCSF